MLGDDDIHALNEQVLTAKEKAQNEHWAEISNAIIKGGIARAAGVASGEGSHMLSWIWYAAGVGENEECRYAEDNTGTLSLIVVISLELRLHKKQVVEGRIASGAPQVLDTDMMGANICEASRQIVPIAREATHNELPDGGTKEHS